MWLSGRLMHKFFNNLLFLFLFLFAFLRLFFLVLIFFIIFPFFHSFQLKELPAGRFKLKVLHAVSEVVIFHGFIALRIIFKILFCDYAILDTRRILLFTTIFIATAWISFIVKILFCDYAFLILNIRRFLFTTIFITAISLIFFFFRRTTSRKCSWFRWRLFVRFAAYFLTAKTFIRWNKWLF